MFLFLSLVFSSTSCSAKFSVWGMGVGGCVGAGRARMEQSTLKYPGT